MMLLTSLYSSASCAQLPDGNITILLENAARQHLTQQAATAGLVEPRVEVTVVKTTRPLPNCDTPLAIQAVDTRQLSRMRFAATCRDGAGWRQEFVVRGSVTAQVLVAAAPVPSGRALVADDVAIERHDVSMIPDSIADVADVVGLASRRALRGGDVLRKAQLQALPVLKRGQEVRIVARREQIEVTMTGEALEPGIVGAVIRVRNVASGNIIRARVLENGDVAPLDLTAGD